MDHLKNEVIKFAKKLNSDNLSPLRSGNISHRAEGDKDGFFITPSGKKYSDLKSDDKAFVSLEGKIEEKGSTPSSEWRIHQDIYLNKNDAKAVVHAHSVHATAVSAHGLDVPAFHYMVALAGGEDIRCAKYATFGTRELSDNIITVSYTHLTLPTKRIV